MTPSRPQKKRLAVAVGVTVVGLFMSQLVPASAMASSELVPPAHDTSINLRLDRAGATRALADVGGAAQEDDRQDPKPMDQQTEPQVVKRPAGSAEAKKEAPPVDRFAFVKDWPFWVIVGGVLVAGVGGYVLLRNTNKSGPCQPQFTAGCFGER